MKLINEMPYGDGVAKVYELEEGGYVVEVKTPDQPDQLFSISDAGAMFKNENMVVKLAEGEEATQISYNKPINIDPEASPFIRAEEIRKGESTGIRMYLAENSFVDVIPGSGPDSGVTANNATVHLGNDGNITFALPDKDD